LHSPTWLIIPIEEFGLPTIRKANLKTSALRHDFMFQDTNTANHRD
jgi:hypothetical protein